MRKIFNIMASFLAVGCLGVLGACGSIGTKTFRQFDINEGQSVSIDATQRVILVTRDPATGEVEAVCAEPSPDALTAAVANAGISAKEPNTQIQAAVTAGFGQIASSIGIRTPTIQLLRDGLYRACEGGMNKKVSPMDYQAILLNIDRVMVGLHAIDGLAGMKTAPLVAIGTGGESKAGDFSAETKQENNVTISPGVQSNADISKIADQIVQVVDLVLIKAVVERHKLRANSGGDSSSKTSMK